MSKFCCWILNSHLHNSISFSYIIPSYSLSFIFEQKFWHGINFETDESWIIDFLFSCPAHWFIDAENQIEGGASIDLVTFHTGFLYLQLLVKIMMLFILEQQWSDQVIILSMSWQLLLHGQINLLSDWILRRIRTTAKIIVTIFQIMRSKTLWNRSLVTSRWTKKYGPRTFSTNSFWTDY